MTLAITGATGQLGRLVLQKLRDRGAQTPVVALVRDTEKAQDLSVETRHFDYDKPDTLAPALDGVDTLLLISGSEIGQRETQHRHVIDAAKAAGVRHVIYTSVLHADTSPLDLAAEHRATESMLADSGLTVTLLRNGWYTENYTGSVPPAVENGAFIGAAGDAKLSTASREDFAEAAGVVATDPGLEGRTFELAGDRAYTLTELAAEISRQTGKDIPYVDMTEDEYANALRDAGLPGPVAGMIAGADTAAAKGALHDESGTLSHLIGRPTTPMSASVKDALS
ncbi:SDR family oxidoreductase [Salipiger sp. IMCC34102]|uniref:SDR family oxidoreductase n=1 Tax=Salipiger sp. IMCC34102 TaxID=2510647 RepID=UPI00101D63AD|nr:SDR family oxidoreductase [Salipiger sp. IMCC34102]RYH04500.1 SDR family oxidoreductase [Salipiger sp. IMCC34102]